ncbi:hypothetical protein ACWDUL_08895 [Nocardia niigatensis]
MSLPSLLDYQQAVLHPQFAFPRDSELRGGTAALTPLSVAAVSSGGFAATFQIANPTSGRSYAVRCFHKLSNDTHFEQRYVAVADFVRTHPELEFLVDVQYDRTGIVVGTETYPTVRMPWVQGDPLGDWVDDHFDEPDAIEEVRANLARAVSRLRATNAAHGDLQHGNIMVGADRSVTLIDYDGMYLPALAPYGASERGHPNYQHPDRDGDTFDESLDTFSAFVIDLSLRAIAHDDGLWDRFGGTGQNLLFTASDFADPGKSDVFNTLLASPLAAQAQLLRSASLTAYEHVPQALTGMAAPPRTARTTAQASLDVMLASNAAGLRKRQGDQVTVVGVVRTARISSDYQGNPIAFINFGDFLKGDFAIVAFGPTVAALQQKYGLTLASLPDTCVTLTELVTLYKNKYKTANLTPQMVLSRANQLKDLTADRYATMLAGASTKSQSPPTKKPTASNKATPTSAKTTQTTGTNWTPPHSVRQQSAGTPTDTDDLLSSMLSRYPATPPAKATPSTTPTPRTTKPSTGTRRTSPTSRPAPRSTQATPRSSNHGRPAVPPPPIQHPVYAPPPAYTVPPPSYNYQSWQTPRQKRRRGRRTFIVILVLIAVLLYLVVLTSHKHHKAAAPALAVETVSFQSPSTNLSCVATLGTPASIRCDARSIRFQPPAPAAGCDPTKFGHTMVLTAGQIAGFICPSDSLLDRNVPPFNYDTTRTIGPFTCEIDASRGITCREIATSKGFRLERDSFEIF